MSVVSAVPLGLHRDQVGSYLLQTSSAIMERTSWSDYLNAIVVGNYSLASKHVSHLIELQGPSAVLLWYVSPYCQLRNRFHMIGAFNGRLHACEALNTFGF